MTNHNVKSRDEAHILKDQAVFEDKFSTYEKMNPLTPWFVSITRVLVLRFTFWVIFIKSIDLFWEKC